MDSVDATGVVTRVYDSGDAVSTWWCTLQAIRKHKKSRNFKSSYQMNSPEFEISLNLK